MSVLVYSCTVQIGTVQLYIVGLSVQLYRTDRYGTAAHYRSVLCSTDLYFTAVHCRSHCTAVQYRSVLYNCTVQIGTVVYQESTM